MHTIKLFTLQIEAQKERGISVNYLSMRVIIGGVTGELGF
jgi:hypothetical protein